MPDMQTYNLWPLLEVLADQFSLAPENIGLAVPPDFVEKKRNRYSVFHERGPFSLED